MFFLQVNKFLKSSVIEVTSSQPPSNGKEINFFVKDSVPSPPRIYSSHHNPKGIYKVRAELTKNRVARRLFEIMESKQTNLCLSADVESYVDLLELVDVVGKLLSCVPYICYQCNNVQFATNN